MVNKPPPDPALPKSKTVSVSFKVDLGISQEPSELLKASGCIERGLAVQLEIVTTPWGMEPLRAASQSAVSQY